jgi:2-polyprenyl-6-methoxyphenol hydroxylase-like FAD-dependent oxidoreductase
MKALIAGGGIGGLTTALMLHEVGIDAEIHEQASVLRELGVGINLLPHAIKELARLGLMERLDAEGIRTRELILANRFGQTVWRELRGLDAGYEVPQISIHRGKLHAILLGAVIDRLGADCIRTDSRVVDFEQDEARVTVKLASRDRPASSASGDFLIGADGIHSAVRAKLYPEEGAPVWSGIMLWRGTAQWPVWRDGRTMVIAGGNFAKFVFYPIACDPRYPHRRLTNWAVMAKVADYGDAPLRSEDWSREGQLQEVLPFVSDRFRLDFVDPAVLIRSTGTFFEYPNCDRDPVPSWSFGRVTLLGDAAHPMYPVGSNGASQAILDARCLADLLKAGGPVADVLAAYDAARRPVTDAIVAANRKGGPEGVIDMVEARAPEGFDDIDQVASFEEREAIVRGYASMAGFAQQQLNKP